MHIRPFQKKALAALAKPGSSHVICVAPTGSGKSLIYERIAAEKGRRTLLITPLVALARQQEARLGALGVRAFRRARESRSGAGAWITSPEALLLARAELKAWAPDFWVVDECHCLWEWGEGFRPAFAEVLGLLREHRPRRSLWLTATLDPASRANLVAALSELTTAPVQIGDFGVPPRMRIDVARVAPAARPEALVAALKQLEGTGVIFANTRETCERLARLLASLHRRVAYYHAGLSSEERVTIETRLRDGSLDCIVATSAFGMGIDIPQLRWVTLWQPPPSPLSLAQAMGRAARNPERESRALIYWDESDFPPLEWMTLGRPERLRDLNRVRDFLLSADCRARGLARYFNHSLSKRCGLCDRCRMA